MKNFKFTIKKVEQLKAYRLNQLDDLLMKGYCITDSVKIEAILFPPKPFACLTKN